MLEMGRLERIVLSESQSENLASSAQFATIACIPFETNKMVKPISAIVRPVSYTHLTLPTKRIV